ncbi:MAG: replication-associated recombination protein A [Erysipelotrichaceae bacterium]
MKKPLAHRMRPKTLNEVIGQQHLIGEGKIIKKCVDAKRVFSMIFYGPPGTGKTTLASVIANELELPYRLFNAVTGNKKDLEIIFNEAKYIDGLIVIVDEVHRLNKDKQDLLLPHIENGNITLIGATTANPFHSINPAIRSRCQLLEIKPLAIDDITKALQTALLSPNGLNNEYSIEYQSLVLIAKASNGDIRFALNLLEICSIACNANIISLDLVKQYATQPNMLIDNDGDGYYNVLSAFQKSIRGSDVNGALYYLGIMIKANDLDSIERRLLVTAYEDVGLGNPAACARCVQALAAARIVGFPEGRIPLSNAIIDLCLSPKSKSAELAIDSALTTLEKNSYQVPSYLALTPVGMNAEDLYDYSRSDLWPLIQYLPNSIANQQFYIPNTNSQYEQTLAANYNKINKIKRSPELAKLKNKR